VGKPLGNAVGKPLGSAVGNPLGSVVGKPLGMGNPLGSVVGKPLGNDVGKPLGSADGRPLGNGNAPSPGAAALPLADGAAPPARGSRPVGAPGRPGPGAPGGASGVKVVAAGTMVVTACAPDELVAVAGEGCAGSALLQATARNGTTATATSGTRKMRVIARGAYLIPVRSGLAA
jgi:hypothetical protein